MGRRAHDLKAKNTFLMSGSHWSTTLNRSHFLPMPPAGLTSRTLFASASSCKGLTCQTGAAEAGTGTCHLLLGSKMKLERLQVAAFWSARVFKDLCDGSTWLMPAAVLFSVEASIQVGTVVLHCTTAGTLQELRPHSQMWSSPLEGSHSDSSSTAGFL